MIYFTAHTFKCVCHCRRAMFRVLGMYNFGFTSKLVSKMNSKKMASAWRNFKNIFSRPLFTIIFRPKLVFLDTDSILRVKTMYESVRGHAKVGVKAKKTFRQNPYPE